jgi:16S rRNA processing protein RimM
VSRPTQFEVGYVARARGLKGELVVRTFDPSSQALAEVEKVSLRLKDGIQLELQIQERAHASSDWILRFRGIEDRSAAERLAGAMVSIYREDLEPPVEGEYFQGDLIGIEVLDESGQTLGRVESVLNSGPVPNLVIRRTDGSELLVPFADDFVATVDAVAGQMVLRPSELLE